ncbi:methionine ABC transporter substrate-binding lipoprotein MetQ [Mucilaginibacter sp. FT3.2]|uniref:methionine ABC transporter substrate-binding lipoprotein MetQ n=1 Tax=Mucilaginibacter sp. FT3.2 TaxID=2723090 RepID=UPI001622CAB1|nr:methionine ABC transporter substrate-binding lipoprotein MetQ [Mucilaginibacter sp. FT3.2]MBB6233864.1 D-methionine transport system substrate-binding protein [Mucilaginibacter sp. FT3.2]
MNIKTLSSIVILSVSLAACGRKPKTNNSNQIKVGVESGPEYKVAEAAQKVAKEKYNLDVELVQFSDYVMPNAALSQGDIDLNVFQNKPYLDVQAKQRGYKFAILGNTFVFPLAGYSHKIKSIDQLKDGSTIIIPNDPTNSGRSLLLLQKAGLVKLKDGVGLLPTLNDIVSNPKNLKILELEAPQLPRSLDDQNVTIAIINNTFAGPAGLVAKRDGLFIEDEKSPYVNIIVSRDDNKNQDNVARFVKAYQSPEVAQAAEVAFKGGAIKGW